METTVMNVPLDDKTLAALFVGKRLVAVTDAGGQVVGYFAPALTEAEMARRHLGLPDPEELRHQRDSAENTYTTAQVKEYLESLGKKG
jgi:hypothetical protein